MNTNDNPQRLPFKEGTWFAIPLRQGGFAVGRVARLTPTGEIIIAYVFGPRRGAVPGLEEIQSLQAIDAVKVIHTSALGIVEGTWPVIGDSPQWEREDWPMPDFIRRDELTETALRVTYADDYPGKIVSEERVPYDTMGLEREGLYGDVAAEIHLSKVLEE